MMPIFLGLEIGTIEGTKSKQGAQRLNPGDIPSPSPRHRLSYTLQSLPLTNKQDFLELNLTPSITPWEQKTSSMFWR